MFRRSLHGSHAKLVRAQDTLKIRAMIWNEVISRAVIAWSSWFPRRLSGIDPKGQSHLVTRAVYAGRWYRLRVSSQWGLLHAGSPRILSQAKEYRLPTEDFGPQ